MAAAAARPHIIGGFQTPLTAAIRGRSDRLRIFLATDRIEPHVEERLALETVRVAIELGNDVNAPDRNGSAPLHDAAGRNLTTVVRLLVESGADIEVKDRDGRTALQLADAAERRRAFREDTVEEASTAEILRELGRGGAARIGSIDPSSGGAEAPPLRTRARLRTGRRG